MGIECQNLVTMDEVAKHNQRAWDRQSREGCRWSIPVGPEEIAAVRAGGQPRIILTPDTPVPAEWLGTLQDRDVLCLASGGGQQAPLLAAAGAKVTSFELSEEQLARDREVAERENLPLLTIQGDMRDLSALADASFDLIVHVCSNCFCPEIEPVWRECHRVLRDGGDLLVGFINPSFFLFDWEEEDDPPVIRFPLPYSDRDSLSEERYRKHLAKEEPLLFSHSLDEQIGGQLAAGFALIGLFEDGWKENSLDPYFRTMVNTRARKLES